MCKYLQFIEVLQASALCNDDRAEDGFPHLGAVRPQSCFVHDGEVRVIHAVVVGVLLNGHQSFRAPDLVVDDVTHCGVLRNKKWLGFKLLTGSHDA